MLHDRCWVGAVRRWRFVGLCVAMMSALASGPARAQNDSVSLWDAADFRSWTFVPYWTSQSQLNSFPADNMYDHVSDVLYFSGVMPTASGNLAYHSNAAQHLTALTNHAAAHGFQLHMSMRDPSGGSEEAVWNSITSSAANRANFVNNVANLLQTHDMKGFNLDWERPNTVSEWANYTQLAKDLRAAIEPLEMEVSVDDYGFVDSRWDDSPVFDARTYDQLFIMGYHYPAFGGGSLNYNTFANQKLSLVGQGAEKAFTDEQLVVGIGTWGAGVDPDGQGGLPAPPPLGLKSIAASVPDLAYNIGTYTQGANTWTIESREQVRAKVQLALDRDMAGIMFWTLHFDATNKLGLHQVAHHYIAVKREIPDLNLDGDVSAADANALADNMGSVPGWTGTNTPARFDDFYLSGNWEEGDRDGNGFVNQQDADWLSGRFAALGVNLPDRLAYTGTFENYGNSRGITGRWRAARHPGGNLMETGNFTQHAAGVLPFAASGPGADRFSSGAVTLRNQNAAEAFDAINTGPRVLEADLETPIDLGGEADVYFTFLVRQNTGPLLASQAASPDRTLALEFLDAAGTNQFDLTFHGQQQQFAINSRTDAGGEDVVGGGFGADTVHLVVGKIAGNGEEANTLHASIFAPGSAIENFTYPGFEWMLTAESSSGFNPTITDLRWRSLYEANYTVSNVWLGTASTFFTMPASALGDFNGDGMVDAADYTVWSDTRGATVTAFTGADANGNGTIDADDYSVWKSNFGASLASGLGAMAASAVVPEPGSVLLMFAGAVWFAQSFSREVWPPAGRRL